MSRFYQSPFFEALGWTLIDSLWQLAVLWIIYVTVTANGKRFSSSVRYIIALLVLAAANVWLLISFFLNYSLAVQDPAWYGITYLLHQKINELLSGRSFFHELVPFLSILYVFLVGLSGFRLLYHWRQNQRLIKKSYINPPPSLYDYLAKLCERFPAVRKIELWMSEHVHTPLTTGFLKPVIILPVAIVNQLSIQQAEALIAHEFFHIRRYDYMCNLFVVMTDILLFFNPFARILTGIIRKERENSCDDHVLKLGVHAWEYSQALYMLGRNQVHLQSFALGATGNNSGMLLFRIRRILRMQEAPVSLIKPLLFFFFCLGIAFFSATRFPAAINTMVEKTSSVSIYTVTSGSVVMPTTISPKPEKPELMETEVVLHRARKAEKKLNAGKEANENLPRPTLANPVVEPVEEWLEEDHINYLIHSFASDDEELEFTILNPEQPDLPIAPASELPLPYVPGSTFYCPMDSLPIPGRIIRI